MIGNIKLFYYKSLVNFILGYIRDIVEIISTKLKIRFKAVYSKRWIH